MYLCISTTLLWMSQSNSFTNPGNGIKLRKMANLWPFNAAFHFNDGVWNGMRILGDPGTKPLGLSRATTKAWGRITCNGCCAAGKKFPARFSGPGGFRHVIEPKNMVVPPPCVCIYIICVKDLWLDLVSSVTASLQGACLLISDFVGADLLVFDSAAPIHALLWCSTSGCNWQ